MTCRMSSEPSSIDVLLPIVAPFPVDEAAERHRHWLEALQSVGDVHQAALSGQDAVRRLAARFGLRRPGSKLLGMDESSHTSYWEPALEECGRAFVEECAKLVEMGSGSPLESRVAPKVLSCAVRLAEALGQTGPLLTSLEKELAFVGERNDQLEALYHVVVKRVESLAGQLPFLERSASEAKASQEETRAEVMQLRRSLKAAEQQNAESARQKAELRTAHQNAQREADYAKARRANRRPRRCLTPSTCTNITNNSGIWSDGASPRERSTASIAVQAGDGNVHHHHHHHHQADQHRQHGHRQPSSDQQHIDQQTDHSQVEYYLQEPSFTKQGSLDRHMHQHHQSEGLPATADVDRDAAAGVSAAAIGASPQTTAHVLPQAGYSSRKSASESGSAGLPVTSLASLATPSLATPVLAVPLSREACAASPQLTPRRRGDRLHTDPINFSGHWRRTSVSSATEASAMVTSKPSHLAAPLSTGNLLSTAYESRLQEGLTSQNMDDRASYCTSVSGSGRLSTGAGTGLLERGSMWALALKQTDPLSASATAAFMHLAALAREAQERHPGSNSLQSSPRDADELCSLRPTEGLKWVADSVAHWAEHELAALDRALATSIKHAAVNLRSLVRLVS